LPNFSSHDSASPPLKLPSAAEAMLTVAANKRPVAKALLTIILVV
jgi:hypothetical protein